MGVIPTHLGIDEEGEKEDSLGLEVPTNQPWNIQLSLKSPLRTGQPYFTIPWPGQIIP